MLYKIGPNGQNKATILFKLVVVWVTSL